MKKDIPINKVILYGSYAKGKAKKGSDVDIVIISEKFGKNPQKEGKYLFRKLWDVENTGIEPVGYSSKDFYTSNPSPLLYEIKKLRVPTCVIANFDKEYEDICIDGSRVMLIPQYRPLPYSETTQIQVCVIDQRIIIKKELYSPILAV